MTKMLSPGVVYIVRDAPRLLLPPAFVIAANALCRAVFGFGTPTWLLAVGCILSYPVFLEVLVQWKQFSNARAAAALGAVLPPAVECKLPGGIDLVLAQMRGMNTRFIGTMVFNCSEKYGNIFRRPVFYEEKFLTTEPEYIKNILATNFSGFEKGPAFGAVMNTLLGIGVFNSDGDMWKFHRAMTRPFFSKDRISHFDIFLKHADDAFDQMNSRLQEGYAVDFQDLVSRFTLDSATEFLFGQDVCSLSAGLPYPPTAGKDNTAADAHPANQFSRAFLNAQLASIYRSRLGKAWRLREIGGDRVRPHLVAIDAFIGPLLRNALERKAQRQKSGTDKEDTEDETLLGHLASLTDDPQVLRDETLNILLAGRDTTAATLTFAVYKLAQNPDLFARLREEILSKIGPSRPPSYDDIRDLKFLRAVINETLRLYPPVPFNERSTTAATVWPSLIPGGKPIYIPANTRVQYSVFVMHRRKDLWGPDAHTFDPDRFLDERVQKYLTPNPFIFLPFNAGPRICLGQQFAYNEVSFMLVRLMQKFSSLALALDAAPESRAPEAFARKSLGTDGSEEMLFSSHLTIHAKHGLWVKMTAAGPSEAV